MADPTLSLTFRDMIVRVAEYLGIAHYGVNGNEVAQAPTQSHDLDLCKRLVNDGWRRFCGSWHHWQWMHPTFTITFDPTGVTGTVNLEAWRYHLPDGFYGDMTSNFTYGTSGPAARIELTTEEHIRELRAGGASTGTPQLYAVRPITVPVWSFGRPGWEAIFYPTPSGTETVTARCRIWPNQMGSLNITDKPNCGFQHDATVLAAAIAEAELQQHPGRAGTKYEEFKEALRNSINLDLRSTPRRMSPFGGRVGRAYTGVDQYTSNGVVYTP